MFECACCHSADSSSSKANKHSSTSSSSQRNEGTLACDDYPMIEVDEAIKIVLTQTQKLPSIRLPLESSYGHIIAEDIIATQPFPSFLTSMMDGYAVCGPITPGNYSIQNRIFAGDETTPFDSGLTLYQSNQPPCSFSHVSIAKISYITTGSQVPEGANSVVKVEDTEMVSKEEGIVSIQVEVKPGENIRTIGSDISPGELIISAGSKIGPAEIGLLATIGIVEVPCNAKPVVGIMSTGDELVEPSVPPTGSKVSHLHLLVVVVD